VATIKIGYSAETAMTVTGLASLASSPTAGWQSAVVDNTTDLYLDALVQVVLDFANTAPGASQAAYVYAYGGLATTYSDPASGSQGAITLPDVTTSPNKLRLIGTIPYSVQNEVAESSPMSVCAAFAGLLPPKWGLVIVNHSGAALDASGHAVSWRGVHLTAL
jgi:hypothetical protein